MRILVSGFEPFLEEKVNPTQSLVEYANSDRFQKSFLDICALKNQKAQIQGVILPVVFGEAFQILKEQIERLQPDIVISFGLAASRKRFEVEFVARNERGGHETAQGDNKRQVFSGKIDQRPEAIPEFLTTLPYEKILNALRQEDIPCGLSESAGNYVCNDLFYQMQAYFQILKKQVSGKEEILQQPTSGFIHVPKMEDDGMNWPVFERAFQVIIQACLG